MKLLIVTQVVDTQDPVLGFFHDWIARLAPNFEQIIVICLKEGTYMLPANVRVYSLGKEKGSAPAFIYAIRFKWLAWKHRSEYDRVFVHMNQEYLLIAGPLWKILHKPAYLWRNHYAGSFLTDIAATFCTKVFCTSRHSYTAKYKKTVLMPVGVDLERFSTDSGVRREPHSILFLARISPSKRADMLIEALGMLLSRSISFIASIYGSPKTEDEAYYSNLKARVEQLGLHDRVRFHAGVPNEQTPSVYQAHDIFVNCSKSGMYDKTLFEAAASGCLVLAGSNDWRGLAGDAYAFEDSTDRLSDSLARMLDASDDAKNKERRFLEQITVGQGLTMLTRRLVEALEGNVVV